MRNSNFVGAGVLDSPLLAIFASRYLALMRQAAAVRRDVEGAVPYEICGAADAQF